MKQYNSYSGRDLTFLVCAYGQCPYLDEAVSALVNQTEKANIIISTSTPNDLISSIAEKYHIEVRINPHGGQIEDYNFAFRQAKTPLAMLAHQDEILKPQFVEKVIFAINHSKDPIIAFTDYIEMHNDKVDEKQSSLVRIKKIMLLPMKSKKLAGTRFGKRLVLRFGDPITHPTVVHVMKKLPVNPFREEFKASMDWDLWTRLAEENGSFVYVDEILLYHRMNDQNQTAKLLKTTDIRSKNEYEIFCRYWPEWFAKFLMKFYSKAHGYY
ncbi:MAG: glycosyltransferase family 2 protein [Erysipelotrichaceae bacterium]|jgi:GTP:adenosylcobinamide-phosphate guanylyltransferase|nr:glycosyltransferase family 2 protein [Erysipelotrichaceae bacterium]MCH4044080.1 glycosyltransferase family 2 protein [Erysipelotrichaceae bacterium]MCH4121295.1 glycosyltransferase family 2 protein [Erysipelotrichaceae bacterium]